MTTIATHPPRGDDRRTLTPLPTTLTRLARLINDRDLPDAAITVQNDGHTVTVDATSRPQPETTVRRWADALGLEVIAKPYTYSGVASTMYLASDVLDGVIWHILAIVPFDPQQDDVGRVDEIRNDAQPHVFATVGGVR